MEELNRLSRGSRLSRSARKTRRPFEGADLAQRPTLSPYSQALSLALLRGREAVMTRLRPILRAHGVTEQQWRVLRILNDVTETDVTDLARTAFLHGPSLTRILRDLSARELVRRRVDDADMRRALVSLSPKGAALIKLAGQEVAVATHEINTLYGDERGAQLRALLIALEQVLDTGRGSQDRS